MPKQVSYHSLVSLRNLFNLTLQEFASAILPHLKDPSRAAKLVGGYQNGSNSLKNQPEPLKQLVSIFGLRPECVLPLNSDGDLPLHLTSLSGADFTRAWFLAWTYTGMEMGSCIKDRWMLTLKVERATQLYNEFLRRKIPWQTMLPSRVNFLNEDDVNVLDALITDLIPGKRALFEERESAARSFFAEIAENNPRRDSEQDVLEDYESLFKEFRLAPVFRALGYTAE